MDIKKNLNRWFAGRKQKDVAPAQESPDAAAVAVPVAAAVEPEIVAVIMAVLAVEVKIFTAMQGHHFTFSENGQPQGWSEWGRSLVRPYGGVR